MGVLYARVAGAWVPINGSILPPNTSYVTDPAYVGPRRDGATQYASFSNLALAGRVGFNVTNLGQIQFVGRTGQKTQFTEADAAGTTETWVADISLNRFQLADICIGTHPATGINSIWLNSAPAAADYILARDSVGAGILNARAGSNISLRVANAEKFYVSNTGVQVSNAIMLMSGAPYAGDSWNQAPFWIQSSGPYPRIACHSGNYAPQLCVHNPSGEKWFVTTAGGGSRCPIVASAFEVQSSVTTKEGVRSLRPEREHITVMPLDPESDVVEAPDVMALRPVVFRPNHEKDRSAPHRIIDFEQKRERLGLIAEDVQHVIPSAVTHDADGNVVGVDYAQITVALLDHVQELTRTVDTLRYRIAELEGTA